jgi:hypothetical protein
MRKKLDSFLGFQEIFMRDIGVESSIKHQHALGMFEVRIF